MWRNKGIATPLTSPYLSLTVCRARFPRLTRSSASFPIPVLPTTSLCVCSRVCFPFRKGSLSHLSSFQLGSPKGLKLRLQILRCWLKERCVFLFFPCCCSCRFSADVRARFLLVGVELSSLPACECVHPSLSATEGRQTRLVCRCDSTLPFPSRSLTDSFVL